MPVPLFFRLHFVVRGRFFPGGGAAGSGSGGLAASVGFKGCPVMAEASVPRGADAARFVLDFPMSGVFQGEGCLRLRDIFGFYSFSCGLPQSRTLRVRSAPCFGKKLHINAQTGAEDKRNKQSSDEERYYMREYTPGDRFRDINWKSSEKIDTLITRISPDNQEKVSRIEVYFRNYGPSGGISAKPSHQPSLEALWLLDRAKARLSHFLRTLMEEQSNYIFHIRCAQGSWEVEDAENLEDFLDELAGLPFAPLQNDSLGAVSQGGASSELYVFSTACDAGLAGFLLGCNPRPVSLFMTQLAEAKAAKEKPVMVPPPASSDVLCKRDFLVKGVLPKPNWVFKKNIKPLYASAAGVENVYAEVRL